MNCKHCNKLCKSKVSLAQHEIRCPKNENRTAVGLTKETAKTSGSGSRANALKLAKFNSAKRFSDDVVFVADSTYPRHRLKERLIKNNTIPYECSCCGVGDSWNGSPLSLQLDHINGKNNDNRLENLRFLCPNCHSQQDTYAAKNIVKKKQSLV